MLKIYHICLTATVLFIPHVICAQSSELTEIADLIDKAGQGVVKASYEVQLPSSPDPVIYEISAEYKQCAEDTLAKCQYIIDWTLKRENGDLNGFSAYFDGNHYRFRDVKLQEYHTAEDPTAFTYGKGVQNTAQFTDLLPPFIADNLRKMAVDSTYDYTISCKGDEIRVDGVQRVKGYDTMEYSYVFDPQTGMLKSASVDYNPASISEQNITVEYGILPFDGTEMKEKTLTERYPDIFSRYRRGNYAVTNLKGTHLPGFEAIDLHRRRYARRIRDNFVRPTVILLVSPDVASSGEAISAVTEGIQLSPVECSLIVAVTTNDSDTVATLCGPDTVCRTVLMSAKSMALNLGVNEFPTIIYCNSDATVADVDTGFNNNTASVVLQKTLQLK